MIDAQFAGYTPEQMYNLLEYTPEKATPEQVRAIGECLWETEEAYQEIENEGYEDNEDLRNRVDKWESTAECLYNSLWEVVNYAGGANSALEDEYVMGRAADALKDFEDWEHEDHNN